MGCICIDRQRAYRDFLLMTERVTASSVPVRASGEPKWVSAARKLVASTRLIKTGDGVHLLEIALAEYDQSAAASPSDGGARQPQDIARWLRHDDDCPMERPTQIYAK